MFSHSGPVMCHVYFPTALKHDNHNSQDSIQILLSNKDHPVLIVSVHQRPSLLYISALLQLYFILRNVLLLTS